MPLRTVVTLFSALLLAACGGEEQSLLPRPDVYPLAVTDDEDVEMTIEREPRRIVTFAPSHTETLFALGLGDRVVGVSGPFDDHPPEAVEVEHVSGEGGTEPNIEKVVSLEADLVLTAFIGGDWKQRLRDLGIPVFTSLASSLHDTFEDIRTVGQVVGAGPKALDLSSELEAQAERIEGSVPPGERVTCFLELSDLFTVGPGSLEYDLLERAGCDPVTDDAEEPYPQWSVEQLVEDDPDVFLASEAGGPVEKIVDRPGIRDLPAVQRGSIGLVDGDLISRPGPRIVQGLAELREALGAR